MIEPAAPLLRARPTRIRRFLSVAFLVVIAALLFAPLLPAIDATNQNLADRLTPPVWLEGGSWVYPLGTDQLGRDLLSRLVVGSRLTILIAFGAVFLAGAFGTFVGIASGYKRGVADLIVSRVVDAQLAFPVFLLALAIIATQGRSIPVLIVVLAVVGWARYARVIRSEVLSLRERPFVLGLRAAGASDFIVIFRHLLPNVANTVLVLATLEVGFMILAESALSFLGLGVVSPQVSWGAMLAEGRQHMQSAWWVVAFPGLAITLTVLTVNVLGDAFRSRLSREQD